MLVSWELVWTSLPTCIYQSVLWFLIGGPCSIPRPHLHPCPKLLPLRDLSQGTREIVAEVMNGWPVVGIWSVGLFYFCQSVVFKSLTQLPKLKNQEIHIKLGVYSFFANKYIWLCRAYIPTGQSVIGVAWLGRIPSSFLGPHPTLSLIYVTALCWGWI